MIGLNAKNQDAGKRLDVFVAENIPELSRSFVQTLCDAHKIKVNGAAEPSKHLLKLNDKVTVAFDPAEHKPAKIDLPIIYEDDDCIVINKPAGLLTHSKGNYNPEPTVASFIAPKLKGLTGERAGIVHRLDRATSGVIICAKNSEAQSWLQKQFSTHKAKKTYVAVVEGRVEPAAAVIDMPIERNPKNPKTFKVSDTGRQAITQYSTLKSNANRSLIELRPQTGRTHQLRVHLKQLGHPIIGDTLYRGSNADRLYLHALSLEITLPSRERKVFKVELPNDFNKLVS